MPHLADIKSCTGCLVCVDTCSKNALSPCYNDEGHLTYLLDASLCVECGLCEKKCPVVSVFHYGFNSLSCSRPYASWSKDEVLRPKSSSGGIFASLAKYVIVNGGVAIGASLHMNEVNHIVVDNVDDIWKLQGSKYTQSFTGGIYRKVQSFLKEGRTVLFSGLGCQVAGLLSFMKDKQYEGQLYTIDLICGGVPSRFIIDRYLEENPDVKEIAGFRNKGKYEFSIIDKDGKKRVIPLNQRPFPLCGFYTELTNRFSCYDCRFNGAHRIADMTIGDYWGDQDFLIEHSNGISVAVAHSESGEYLLKNANIEIHEIGWDNFLLHNPRMIDGHKSKSRAKARLMLSTAFKSYSYEKLLQIYANKATWLSPLTILKKMARYMKSTISIYIYKKILQKKINKLQNS